MICDSGIQLRLYMIKSACLRSLNWVFEIWWWICKHLFLQVLQQLELDNLQFQFQHFEFESWLQNLHLEYLEAGRACHPSEPSKIWSQEKRETEISCYLALHNSFIRNIFPDAGGCIVTSVKNWEQESGISVLILDSNCSLGLRLFPNQWKTHQKSN